jgi:PD-(D/E)XK nuclease superfamily
VIKQLSISQVEAFDHSQEGGCERKWFFDRAAGLKADQTAAQTEGEAGHALLAAYLSTGALPARRTLMGKAVTGAIVKGELPTPGPDLLVEERFDGQPKFSNVCECGRPLDAHGEGCPCTEPRARWVPLDVENTLTLAGIPFEGFIDLAFRRGDVPEIWDHKFFTPARPDVDPDPYVWLKKPSELINTVQLPVYVLSQVPYWPDAKRWRIAHHYVSKKGVDSQIRPAIVTLDQVLERKATIEQMIERMKVVSEIPITQQSEVPFNRRACDAWRGCPHQSICSAFKQEKPKVTLTPEEEAMFAGLDGVDVAPPPQPTAPVEIPKVRRMPMIDVPAPDAAPAPVAAPVETDGGTCADCSAKITAENGAKMHDGWRHIGCPAKAKPATPAAEVAAEKPAPRARKPKTPAPTPTETPVTPEVPAAMAPPVFAGERESDRAATAALDAIAAKKAPLAVLESTEADHALMPDGSPPVPTADPRLAQSPWVPPRAALASLLRSLAVLVESVG